MGSAKVDSVIATRRTRRILRVAMVARKVKLFKDRGNDDYRPRREHLNNRGQ